MALFKEQIAEVREFMREVRANGRLRDLPSGPAASWPRESSLVLSEDTAIELGHPAAGSMSLLLWTDQEGPADDEVLLLGPDLHEMTAPQVPFGLVMVVQGRFQDEYETSRDLRSALYDTKLQGFMIRTLPSQQMLWARVSRTAMAAGLSLAHFGAALVENFKSLEGARAAQVLFVTSGKDDLERLGPAAFAAGRITAALTKMGEEMSYDCESCEFQKVCDAVTELKAVRQRLLERRAP